jgi:hypothetical protein
MTEKKIDMRDVEDILASAIGRRALARRYLAQGAVKFNGCPVNDDFRITEWPERCEVTWGKTGYARVRVGWVGGEMTEDDGYTTEYPQVGVVKPARTLYGQLAGDAAIVIAELKAMLEECEDYARALEDRLSCEIEALEYNGTAPKRPEWMEDSDDDE